MRWRVCNRIDCQVKFITDTAEDGSKKIMHNLILTWDREVSYSGRAESCLHQIPRDAPCTLSSFADKDAEAVSIVSATWCKLLGRNSNAYVAPGVANYKRYHDEQTCNLWWCERLVSVPMAAFPRCGDQYGDLPSIRL